MSSVVVEYPEGLPAPTTGSVTITERRKGSTIGGRKNFRTFQRDRHGQRTIAFTFTPAQSAIFREWWAEWLKRGGGWFAADWPLPWTRGPSVFRFQDPPQWALMGGTLTGQGYWRVTATVEIRGRGMLPTMEVLYLTSKPYPIAYKDSLESTVNSNIKEGLSLIINSIDISVDGKFYARSIYVESYIQESILTNVNFAAGATKHFDGIYIVPPESIETSLSGNFSAKVVMIRYNIPAESLETKVGANFNAS